MQLARLVLLVGSIAGAKAAALGETAPDITAAATSPREGAVGVPTNARFFLDTPVGVRASLVGDAALVEIDASAALTEAGADLGALAADTDYRIEMNDGVNVRDASFRTGAADDVVAPTMTDEVPTATACSFFTGCDGDGAAPGPEQEVETFRVEVRVPRAADDGAVALYRLYRVDDQTRRLVSLLQQSTRNATGLFPTWQEEPVAGETVALIAVDEIGFDSETHEFVVVAVDLAGNESAPSPSVFVELPRSTAEPPVRFVSGCAAIDVRSSVPWVEAGVVWMVGVAGVRRRSARRGAPAHVLSARP